MIRFEGAAKRFPGADRPALEPLDLRVGEGETLALIGPSGCGKTTALRLVNRLIEPTEGRVRLGGVDVAGMDPVRLRRGIGYVIQGVGLFPHRTIAENVGTVPGLLGWDRSRTSRRVDAMLALVGLDPGLFRDRKPASLSGGQRQRAGIARALAADPPVLLLDEPLGAVDPLERLRVRRELAAILRDLGKTVVLVTHDIDEAVAMATTVAVMRAGRLVALDTPNALLARPPDAFVAEFLGRDRALRALALVPAREVADPGPPRPDAPVLPGDANLADALAVLLERGVEEATVDGRRVTLDAIRRRAAGPGGG